jgi:hypothetical protein
MTLMIGIVRRVLVLAIVVAVPVVAGELVARKLIGDAVTSAVRAKIGSAPDVNLGSAPVLLQLVRGRINAATLHARDARIGDLPPAALTATLRDVRLADVASLEGAIGSLRLDVRLAPAAVRKLLAATGCVRSLPANLRGALTPAPRVVLLAGRIDVLPPSGRTVDLRLRTTMVRDAVAFEPSGLELDGAPAPAHDLAGTTTASCTRPLHDLPFGISLVSASARPGALALAFSGRGAAFSALG